MAIDRGFIAGFWLGFLLFTHHPFLGGTSHVLNDTRMRGKKGREEREKRCFLLSFFVIMALIPGGFPPLGNVTEV